MVFVAFQSKNGYLFAHLGLAIRYGVYMYLSFQFPMNNKEMYENLESILRNLSMMT